MAPMTTRVEQLAVQFETANNDLVALVAGCSADQWRQVCVNEERSVGVVAHHVAATYPAFAGIVKRLAGGETYSPTISWEQVHQLNAQQAKEHAAVGQAETLAALRVEGAAVAAQLRTLSDDQLNQSAGVFGGNDLSAAKMVEWVVIGHTLEHLASIRATLAV